jgi:site-specific recombinase XerD
MALEFTICDVQWERYPRVLLNAHAREWLKFQATRGLAPNTIDAYRRDLDAYLAFLLSARIEFTSVVRNQIGACIQHLAQRGSKREEGSSCNCT